MKHKRYTIDGEFINNIEKRKDYEETNKIKRYEECYRGC